MDWRNNLLILEEILCQLDLPDLKSASATCTSWLAASAKAFEATSRVVIPDPRPENAPNLANFLQRFQRVKDFKFKLRGREATSNGLNCILADLPLETSSTLTHLTLDYEPTAEVLEAINSFLAQLTSRFPTLKQLQIWPNADPAEDLVSPSLEFLLDNLVPSAEHPNLTVLRVPVGPNWGSGIDWRFLTSLKKLEQLDLLKFHVRGARYVCRQLTEFAKHFPADVRVSTLNIHLMIEVVITRLENPDVSALSSAFKAMKPETCTLYIEQVGIHDPFSASRHFRQYWPVVDEMAFETLKRINVYYSMVLLTSAKPDAWALASGLVAPLRHRRRPGHNAHVLLRVDVCAEEGSQPISFIELECAEFKAPLIIRHGPAGDFAEYFESFLKWSIEEWVTDHSAMEWPVPDYNALRKYTFDESQEIVAEEQFQPPERNNPGYVGLFAGQFRRLLVAGADSPELHLWRKTDFLSFPHSSSIITAQPSWKQQLKCLKTTAHQPLLASVLLVYSID